MQDPVIRPTASVERRADAIQSVLDERGMKASEAVEELAHLAQEQWIPQNGARVVARAWVDPAFRELVLSLPSEAMIAEEFKEVSSSTQSAPPRRLAGPPVKLNWDDLTPAPLSRPIPKKEVVR